MPPFDSIRTPDGTKPTGAQRSTLRRVLLWSAITLVLAFGGVVTLALLWLRHLDKVHQHCIKQAGSAFRIYAGDHLGVLPYHTNGFGDALLLLVKGDYLPDVRVLCGPGDNGRLMTDCLIASTNVPEESCTRVYVQGLHETNDSDICILFDRKSVPGGDHRYGWGPPVREVCMLDGSMLVISDARWASFVTNQVALLVRAGWDEKTARALYAQPPAKP
jgi:hypothetical protein